MTLSLRSCLGLLAFAAVLAASAGCPSSSDGDPGAGDDAGMSVDNGPPCSRLTTVCKAGGKCVGAPDCASGLCRDTTCHDISPPNGMKDNDETDVDCGGTMAPACADNKGCLVAEDCTDGVCKALVCQAPSPTDGVQNGDETDVDCGGTKAPPCPPGDGCLGDKDCKAVKCDLVNKKCKDPAHDDGIKNLDETGIDCGGPTPTVTRCPPGQGCLATTDCAKTSCNATTHVCDPPTKSDGIQNGTETDVDCGGAAPTNADRCPISKNCALGTDCTSGGCSAGLGNKCSSLSCATAEVAGINSCGAKETGAAGAAHESCCKSLVLPTVTTRRLDKYEITAGRYRTFVTKTGPNIRKWVADFVAANPTSQLAQRMTSFSVLSDIYPAVDRTDNLSLTSHLELDIDNYNGIRGCYNGAGDYAANTYWTDPTHEADFGLPARSLARTVSDEKSLNCAMPIMFAAFCAWDGGELATFADYKDAWGTARYPWGATSKNRPNYNWCNGPYMNGGFTCQCDGVHNIGTTCPAGGFTALSEAGVFYEFPTGTDRSKDNEPLIAAPGRVDMDSSTATSGGEAWYDLAANLAEYTGDWTASTNDFCDFSAGPVAGQPTCTRTGKDGSGTRHLNIPMVGLVGDSWEGHVYGAPGTSPSAWYSTGQYGKFGARCVRPADPY
jgi:hypothetical protein